MDFDDTRPVAAGQVPGRSGWRIFWTVVITVSILVNVILLMTVVGLAAVFAVGGRAGYTEQVIREGRRDAKIVVIDVGGLIEDRLSREVYDQLQKARRDETVKGLILRVHSPGGSASASDRIYNEVLKYRQETGEPVVAFMQSIAASGGYYSSVGCDRIIAEPTAITGSIGVIMYHFVLEELLREKLGIEPAVMKSGPKKDWPTVFEATTAEQRAYIQEKLIGPYYERFVQIVAEGRAGLELLDVKRLADGGIYPAQEALEKKLIDRIGYLDEAIELVSSLAKIEKARVVQYRRPFTLGSLVASYKKGGLPLDRQGLQELLTPELYYLSPIR